MQGVDDRPKKTVIYKPTEQEQQVVVAHRGINLNGRRVSISELAVFTNNLSAARNASTSR